MTKPDDIEERVEKFNRMELPGQMPMMHMGTAYLVNDLWREVQRLRAFIEDHPAPPKRAGETDGA